MIVVGRALGRVRLLTAVAFAAACCCVFPGTVLGAYSHGESEPPFSVGSDCNTITDIAVLEKEELVYVACKSNLNAGIIKRFGLKGEPKPFSATAPYLKDNAITADPGGTGGRFNNSTTIAVDNSSSVNHGLIFVTSAPNVDVFRPSGEYVGPLSQPTESSIDNDIRDIDIGPDGSIYVTSPLPGSRISKYGPGFNEIRRLYAAVGYTDPYGTPWFVRVDSTGGVWQSHGGTFGESEPRLSRFEANQFTEELEITLLLPFYYQETVVRPWVADRSPLSPDPLLTNGFARFDVDLSDDDLYVNRGDRIETYSRGSTQELSYMNAPPFGMGILNGSKAIAVTGDHHVYASTDSNKVVRFGPGAILPDVHTLRPQISEVGHTGATVRGTVEPVGGSPVNLCEIEYGLTTSYSAGTVKCNPDASTGDYSVNTDVSGTLSGLTTGRVYHYRVTAGNASGKNSGTDRIVTPAHVLQVQTLPVQPDELTIDGATLSGTLDPDGMPTSYYFEYGVTSSYGLRTAEAGAGASTGVKTVQSPVSQLPSGKILHYRVVAANANGTTYGEDRTFRVASTPDITNVETKERGPVSATVTAGINPTGFETKYHIEFGPTADLGRRQPLNDTSIGAGGEPVKISEKLEGLSEGVTYHFRIVAINKWGTSTSADTTFDYLPPSCPNDHVRQQTRSSYLPDCRAYELVSPSVAGAVTLWPSDEAKDQCYAQECIWAINDGFANSPPRFAYFGGLGAIDGLDAPAGVVDMYMATRTNNGWVSTVPGLQGNEAVYTEAKQCSEHLDICLDNRVGTEGGYELTRAPFLFTVDGKPLGRLPTNLASVPGGHLFRGAKRMSADASHFAFSSGESGPPFFDNPGAFAFAPGGRTVGLGSAYDNDLRTRTVSLISKLPNGEHVPDESTSKTWIEIPAVSTDGSHILMQTPAAEGFSHLYLRVNDAITYDLTGGANGEFVGMTRNGRKVIFASTAHLTADDTDTGKDIFMWDEDATVPNKITRISTGNGNGNSDECAATGLNACSVQLIAPDRLHPLNNSRLSDPGQDDVMAEGSGASFFFSPEQLDPNRPGVRNEPNLYLYRNGAVQLVATFEPGTRIKRMQVSLDGTHAAFITQARLTSFENDGFDEMYSYDAEHGNLTCVSCNPSGATPRYNVKGSQGGRFMADDGRTFFSTEESLVPQDANGDIMDTYEYVGGRPQLITSGQGSRDFTGGSQIISVEALPELVGLEHVSRDGNDVFFSTFESLVTQDENGQFVKFYDARTNGGFPDDPKLGPCEAADECHGTDSVPPVAPVIGTAASLGQGGNTIVRSGGGKNRKKAKRAKRKRVRHNRQTRNSKGDRR